MWRRLLAVLMLVLFASPVLAEGLTLSLSDPELGSFVLKKEKPLKEIGGGLGGLSIGEFTYNGESLQIHVYRGDYIWDWRPGMRKGKVYFSEYQMDIRVFDKDGAFVNGGGDKRKHLPEYDYFDPYDRFSSETVNRWQQRREALYIKMTALLKKNFNDYPDWWPEIHIIILGGNVFERTREMKKLHPPPPPISGGPEGSQLVIRLYKGNAFEFPSGALGEHSATSIWRYKARTGEWWWYDDYPNHGRYPEEDGMSYYDSCYGVVANPPLEEDVNCATPYGFGVDGTTIKEGHVCNDDTMVQIFYVKHGYRADLYGGCCKNGISNRSCPACSCCN